MLESEAKKKVCSKMVAWTANDGHVTEYAYRSCLGSGCMDWITTMNEYDPVAQKWGPPKDPMGDCGRKISDLHVEVTS
jgi:hypothetical protein